MAYTSTISNARYVLETAKLYIFEPYAKIKDFLIEDCIFEHKVNFYFKFIMKQGFFYEVIYKYSMYENDYFRVLDDIVKETKKQLEWYYQGIWC